MTYPIIPDVPQATYVQSDPAVTTQKVSVKASGVSPTLADSAEAVTISPVNSGLPVNIPTIVQKAVIKSAGSVASLAPAFTNANIPGNSIVVVCGIGNGTDPTIADTNGNTYNKAVTSANSTTFESSIWFAVNIAGGANVVTVTNAGTAASMAVEIYEVSGLLAQVSAQAMQNATATGTSGTSATTAIISGSPNKIAFAGVSVGTAAQTITPATGWTNDSGQQNPTTPSGLYSFVSMSQYIGGLTTITPQATFTSEPWAIACVFFKPVILGIEGTVNLNAIGNTQLTAKAANTQATNADTSLVTALSPANTGIPVNTPVIVQKTSNASTGNVASLAKAFVTNNVAGNSIVVVCGNGNNGTLTVTDSAGNTYNKAVLQANSTTFEAAIFFATGILVGANTVTVTNGGTAASIAMEIYEVSGLIAQVAAQPDQSTSGTGTSATPTLSALAASSPNSLAFLGIAVGTAAQAASVTAATNWTLDSTQNATTPSGLFSFGALSQYLGNMTAVIPTATIAGSEPYAAVAAIFKPVVLGVAGTVTIGGYNYTRVTSAATTLVKAGPGVLHAIVVNKPTSTATIEADDALTNTTPIIGILGAFAASIAPFSLIYDVAFSTGLSVTVGTATVDATIVWK